MELTAVLAKTGAFSAKFEAMMDKLSYVLAGRMESLDRGGSIDETLTGAFRITGYGPDHHVEVIRYAENGKDKTAKVREKMARDERDRRKDPPDPDEEIHLPFVPGEQKKYTFRVAEVHPTFPSRVRIGFEPKEAADNRLFGSAWVDRHTGEILTMGASPSDTSGIVDYVKVTLEFGAQTPFGRGVSKISFETKSSFLFFRKYWRGTGVLSDYRVARGT